MRLPDARVLQKGVFEFTLRPDSNNKLHYVLSKKKKKEDWILYVSTALYFIKAVVIFQLIVWVIFFSLSSPKHTHPTR